MGGIASVEQSRLSFERDLALGLSPLRIIRRLAENLAFAKQEHAMRMGLSEVTYEIKNGRLFCPSYGVYYDELANPSAKRRAAGYPEMPAHIVENLKLVQKLIVSGKVSQLINISPSIDFAKENSTKGQAYVMYREGNKVRMICADLSSNPQRMKEELLIIFPIIGPSLGNEKNGAGVWEIQDKIPPTRQEIVKKLRSIGSDSLADQYEAAIFIGDNVDPKNYIERLIQEEEKKIFGLLKAKKIELNGLQEFIGDKDLKLVLNEVFNRVEAELQAIKASLTTMNEVAESHQNHAKPDTNDVRPQHANDTDTIHSKVFDTSLANADQAARYCALLPNTFASAHFDSNNIRQSAIAEPGSRTTTRELDAPITITLSSHIDIGRYHGDAIYRFMQNGINPSSLSTEAQRLLAGTADSPSQTTIVVGTSFVIPSASRVSKEAAEWNPPLKTNDSEPSVKLAQVESHQPPAHAVVHPFSAAKIQMTIARDQQLGIPLQNDARLSTSDIQYSRGALTLARSSLDGRDATALRELRRTFGAKRLVSFVDENQVSSQLRLNVDKRIRFIFRVRHLIPRIKSTVRQLKARVLRRIPSPIASRSAVLKTRLISKMRDRFKAITLSRRKIAFQAKPLQDKRKSLLTKYIEKIRARFVARVSTRKPKALRGVRLRQRSTMQRVRARISVAKTNLKSRKQPTAIGKLSPKRLANSVRLFKRVYRYFKMLSRAYENISLFLSRRSKRTTKKMRLRSPVQASSSRAKGKKIAVLKKCPFLRLVLIGLSSADPSVKVGNCTLMSCYFGTAN